MPVLPDGGQSRVIFECTMISLVRAMDKDEVSKASMSTKRSALPHTTNSIPLRRSCARRGWKNSTKGLKQTTHQVPKRRSADTAWHDRTFQYVHCMHLRVGH